MNDSFRYIAIIILILVSAFFSATEIAYASVNPARLKSKRQQKDNLALSLAGRIVDNYDKTLSAILIGNNLANTASSAIATLIVIDLFGERYVWLATVLMTVLVLIFGEIIPKVLAKQMAEQFCYITAIPIYALSVI